MNERRSSLGGNLRARSFGFTLVEVCVAMAIGLLILGVAVMGMSGVRSEAVLKKMAARIETEARESLLQAVMEQRTVQVNLNDSLGDSHGRLQVKRYGDAKFRNPTRGEVWEFSPTGVCEPVEVRVSNEVGVIELGFDPLTGCAVRKSVIVNS
ncbi:MAG: prepilin-type N-terminal cleavage/methylation domain-containing protein [Prosthecobacter sp.]|nr:prepilin-type N-terminal cleavage/methylation domain-containing protein [Prosthecobacter sp.]